MDWLITHYYTVILRRLSKQLWEIVFFLNFSMSYYYWKYNYFAINQLNTFLHFLQGVKCWLKNIYNYITQSKNRNPPYFWKGLYRCIDSKCESKFRCHIKDEPIKSGIINISWPIVPINHEKLKKVFYIYL